MAAAPLTEFRRILLLMRADPVLEWRRLTEHYRQMSNGELRLLAAGFADLTDTAQQVLRAELQSRGLGDPQTVAAARVQPRAATLTAPLAPPSIVERPADPLGGHLARVPQLVPDAAAEEEQDGPHDYTWKTVLRECDSRAEAMQLQEALRRGGIESWVRFDGYTTPFAPSIEHQLTVASLQILVAADQLDQARVIAAKPIPQDIIDDSRIEVPEFVAPKCPQCGAGDPILMDVNPANTWQCEQCGREWTEGDKSSGKDRPESDETPS